MPRSRHRVRTLLGIVGTIAILVGAWEAVYLTTQSTLVPSTVAVSIVRDPATGTFGFVPTELRVPFDGSVTFTITNWDPVAHGASAPFTTVTGTMDGMMAYMGWGMMGRSHGETVGSLPGAMVSHTFTLRAGGNLVNVPIPPATDASTPSVVVFSIEPGPPGSFGWLCMASDMGGDGPLMAGTLFVA